MSLNQSNDKNALLIYRVGPVYCCAPALNVETIMLPPTLHHTPGSSEFAGVFRHTQGMVSVIDLRQRFGVDASDWHQPGRIIVAEVTGGLAGFWVDEVDDVAPWPQTGWGQIPPLVPRNVFKRTLLHKQHIHLYADFEELFRYRESGYLRPHIQALQQQAAKTTATEADIATIAAVKAGHESAPEKTFSFGEPEHNTVAPRPAAPVAPAASHKPGSTTPASPPKPCPPITPSARHTPSAVITPASMTAPAAVSLPAKSAPETVAANPPAPQSPAPVTKPDFTLWYLGGVGALLLTLAWLLLWPADEPRRPSVTAPPPTSSQASPVAEIGTGTTTSAAENYQASIARDNEGIVITLEVPADDIAATPADTTGPMPSSPTETTTPATSVHVHTVVRGDTLWDIASHYVHNPWRYPELAKLSKISNPHRIYPGDKVKIILQKK